MDVLEFISKSTIEGTGFDTIWMIIKKEDSTVIGDLGFKGNPDEKGVVEIGYGIVKDEWGKGYGYEAVKALINWGFSNSLVQCIKADCLHDNIGSIKILEKVGMKEVSRNQDYIFWELK